MPSTARGAVALSTALLLAACSASPRLYSHRPAEADGTPVALNALHAIVLESEGRRLLRPGETARFDDEAIVLQGGDADAAPERIELSHIDRLELRGADGRLRAVPVRSPDDLLEFSSLPRVTEILTRDGRRLEVDGERRVARFGLDRLAVEVVDADDASVVHARVTLDEIDSLVLYEPDLLGATLRSPAFWLVSAAAAGLVVWIGDQGDERSLAVE